MNKTIAKITAPTGSVLEISQTTKDPFAKDFNGECDFSFSQDGKFCGYWEKAQVIAGIAQAKAAGYKVEE